MAEVTSSPGSGSGFGRPAVNAKLDFSPPPGLARTAAMDRSGAAQGKANELC